MLDALLDASAITELRTAAVSAVATDLLARHETSRLGLLGGGVQARSHLTAILEVRRVEQVLVWSVHGAEGFRAWAAALGLEVHVCADAEEVVRSSDIVCSVTRSPTPVLRGSWLQSGTHVNAVGAFRAHERELDAEAVARATVVVDMREAAAAEAGLLVLAQREGVISPVHVVAELTDLVVGRHPGRRRADEITVFSSVGLAVQDLAAAAAVVRAARCAQGGREVPFG